MSSSTSQRRFDAAAAVLALLTAAAQLAYSIAFLIVRPANADAAGTAASAFLLAGGLLAVPVLLALYRRLELAGADVALLAFMLGFVGAVGAAIHGGYGVAVAIHGPGAPGPNAVDPRGLLTFGVAGVAVLLVSGVMWRAPAFPRGLARLSGLLGVLLLALYGLRLGGVGADSAALVVPAALAGFVAGPGWYAWLGVHLRRTAGRRDATSRTPARVAAERPVAALS